MRSGLVSIVIPNYNYAHYLREAIDSVLAQTYPEIEIIVVDDGSTDESKDILKSYGGQIKAVIQQNQGVSAARNNGVSKSSGQFISFLDADDSWLPAKIEKQVERFLADKTLGLVHVGVVEVDTDGDFLLNRVEGLEGDVSIELLLIKQSILGGGSGLMVPRSVFDEVGGFDKRLSTSADWDFFYQISNRYPVGFIPEILLKYRVHNSNMHSNVKAMEHDMMIAFEKAFIGMPPELRKIKRRAYGSLHQNLAGSYFVAGEYFAFVHHSFKSLALDPSNIVHFLKYPRTRPKATGERIG
jgi:glycosyltransferase involved in cell wall biosynthesis